MNGTYSTRFRSVRYRWNVFLGLFLLVFSTMIGVLPIYYGVFGDEGDKIAIGSLLNDGYLLYRDLFSHHFPFAYYWSAGALEVVRRILMALTRRLQNGNQSYLSVSRRPLRGALAVGGHSILAVRISVLVFQQLSFLIALMWSRAYLGLGVAAVVWSLLKILFYGHMALYNTFAATALMPLFVLALCLLTRRRHIPQWSWSLVGLFSAIALLSDPLAALPLAVFYVIMYSVGTHRVAVMVAFGICGSLCAVVLLGFALVGTLDDFYRDAILFNVNVYNRYYNLRPDRFWDLLLIAGRMLEIAQSSEWMEVPSLSISSLSAFDRWFLGGFAFRLTFVVATLSLVVQRYYRAAGFLYLIAVVLLFRSEVFFRAVPFVLLGVVLLGILLIDSTALTRMQGVGRGTALRILVSRVCQGIVVLVLALLVWRGTAIFLTVKGQFGYTENFGVYRSITATIDNQSCRQTVRLVYYPGDPFVYFFGGDKPLNRYLFFYPWVAEVGTDDVLNSFVMGQEEDALIYIHRNGSVWGRANSQYMAPLLAYLDEHYIVLDQNTFRSPSLELMC